MEDGTRPRPMCHFFLRLVDVYHWYRFPCRRVGCPFTLLPRRRERKVVATVSQGFLMEGTMDLQPQKAHSQLASFLVDLDPPHPQCGQQNISSPLSLVGRTSFYHHATALCASKPRNRAVSAASSNGWPVPFWSVNPILSHSAKRSRLTTNFEGMIRAINHIVIAMRSINTLFSRHSTQCVGSDHQFS
jgi:hypothetical protein